MRNNYPNMSYCAFENTLDAIEQCMGMIIEAIDSDEDLIFSSYQEKNAFMSMFDKCQYMLEALEQYQEMADSRKKDDNHE